MRNRFDRRHLLGMTLSGTVLAMAPGSTGATAADPRPAGSSSAPAGTVARPVDPRMLQLENEYDVRLGVYGINTATGRVLAHRARERFAFCSVFKALVAAAVLDRNPMSHLDTLVRYTEADLMDSSFITRDHVDTGMTIGELCDATVRYSDGTAGNLLLADLGGPAAFTEWLRGLGDPVTRSDRWEPELNTAIPGDPRDTGTAEALARDLEAVVLGPTLPTAQRGFLRDLLERNTTGDSRIRAALPPGWTAGDKTGTGDYGTANDIAVVWRPDGIPLVLAIMSRRHTPDAGVDDAVLAEAAARVLATIA